MLKKTKFFIGISLLAQSFAFLTIFVILWAKKKSLSKTFLLVGLLGGITGTVLTYKTLREDKQFRAMMDAVDSLCDFDAVDPDEIEVQIDETAKEEDFE